MSELTDILELLALRIKDQNIMLAEINAELITLKARIERLEIMTENY